MNRISLSVVVPVYNVEKYIEECLDSIIQGMLPNMELILIDDGSTDNSGKILDEYAVKYDFIQVRHKANEGIIGARKAGQRLVRGEYALYIDSDDYVDSGIFRWIEEKLNSTDADIVIYNGYSKEGDSITPLADYDYTGLLENEKLDEIKKHLIFKQDSFRFVFFPGMAYKVIRKNILDEILLNLNDNISYGDDAIVSFWCILNSKKLFVTNERFYFYRQNTSSVTHTFNVKRYEQLTVLADEMENKFSGYSNFVDAEKNKYIFYVFFTYTKILCNYEFAGRYKELKKYVNSDYLQKYLKKTDTSRFSKKDKIYVFLIKHKLSFVIYCLKIMAEKGRKLCKKLR